jgi:hypothetical protein
MIYIYDSNFLVSPCGLLPYRWEEVFASQWPGELCWRERKLLVGPLMPDRSKDRGQMKRSPWSSRLGYGCGANDPTTKKLIVTKPSHGGGENPHRIVARLAFQSACGNKCINVTVLKMDHYSIDTCFVIWIHLTCTKIYLLFFSEDFLKLLQIKLCRHMISQRRALINAARQYFSPE